MLIEEKDNNDSQRFFFVLCFLHVATSLEKEKGCVLIGTAAFQGAKMQESPPSDSYRHTTLGECLVCDSGSYSSFCHYLESSLQKRKREKGGYRGYVVPACSTAFILAYALHTVDPDSLA